MKAVDERLKGLQLGKAKGGRRVGEVKTLRVEDVYNAGSLGLSKATTDDLGGAKLDRNDAGSPWRPIWGAWQPEDGLRGLVD